MNDLYLRSEGIGGKGCTYARKGYIEAQFGDDYIFVDNFEGRGDSYKLREVPRICFKLDGKSYNFTPSTLKKQLDIRGGKRQLINKSENK